MPQRLPSPSRWTRGPSTTALLAAMIAVALAAWLLGTTQLEHTGDTAPPAEAMRATAR